MPGLNTLLSNTIWLCYSGLKVDFYNSFACINFVFLLYFQTMYEKYQEDWLSR